ARGYHRRYRHLVVWRTIVTADRVRLGGDGADRGRTGKPFSVPVDIEGTPRDLGGLVDGEPVLKGQIVRVVTTGGGGWGDPLEREPALVLADVVEGRVSAARARDDYGVVLVDAGDTDGLAVDEPGTAQLRAASKAKRTVP